MNEEILKLYNEVRTQMIAIEQVNNTINQKLNSKDEISKKLGSILRIYTNNILAEFLILYDFLFQVLEAGDNNDIEILIESYNGDDHE